ncbi:hypothetical protein L1049_001525 [Liquidambar formosana]|uniref:TF-B3 domain-containing protein n=1 Tax=Liquidambar formosana TaxID=63359 RepID=A0AAP0NAQ6_LIQFO
MELLSNTVLIFNGRFHSFSINVNVYVCTYVSVILAPLGFPMFFSALLVFQIFNGFFARGEEVLPLQELGLGGLQERLEASERRFRPALPSMRMIFLVSERCIPSPWFLSCPFGSCHWIGWAYEAQGIEKCSAYEDGRFCEIFHSHSDGWRNCDSCGKASNQSSSSLWNATLAQLLQCSTEPVEVERFDETERVISGINHGADPVGPFGSAVPNALPCATNGQTRATETLSKSPAPLLQLGEKIYANSLNEADASFEAQIDKGKPQGAAHGRIQLHPQHCPEISDHELPQISRNSNSVVTPLFEKILSPTDTDHKLARLVIPKKCAEAYFPKISQQQGLRIKVLDTRGKEWVFHYRYWSNHNGKMYILEGLKDYMNLMQWKPGDKVIFYQIEPEGQLVMGLKKASSVPQHLEEPAPALG